MPGQPLKSECHRVLDEREGEVFDRLAAGEYVTELCRDMLQQPYEEAGKGEVQSHYLYSWLDAEDGRRARFDRVRESAADMVAEESVRLLDEAREEGVESTAEASIAREQAKSRQWWASRLNRAKYGDGPGVQVNVSKVEDLHLAALQQHGSMEKAREDGHLPPAEPDQLPEGPEPAPIEDGSARPAPIEAEYEEIEAEEAENAARRAKREELEQE